MGNYRVGGKKKGIGRHHRKYRDDDKIDALHSLYKAPKNNDDDSRDDDDNDGYWDDMEEKEEEEYNDDGNNIVNITTV